MKTLAAVLIALLIGSLAVLSLASSLGVAAVDGQESKVEVFDEDLGS